MSNIRKILCHAEFNCTSCGKPYLCMALAPVDPRLPMLTVIGDAERTGLDICKECAAAEDAKEHDAWEARMKLRREQKKWRNGNKTAESK